MKTNYFVLVIFLSIFFQQETFSQFGFSHEVGVITGPVIFYSDYGQRNNIETNMKNVGYGVGLIHYMNFAYRADCNCYTRDTYFNDHFKVRTEISYHTSKLEHFGRWVDPSKTSLTADQLRGMRGSTSVFDIGSQLEYFPLSIRDFVAGSYKIAPFVSLGAHWVNYSPDNYTEFVPTEIGQPLYPDKYGEDARTTKPGTTWSVVWSFGFRYKLTRMSDLMLDGRWQYYFSNWVDGLNPDVPENKANDWIYWLNIGYVLYLD
ncbi:THC0290_0291 family protein [Planktosalinus lacus]|uniref:Glutamate dehydrogenase n=1 Tax=Planktosalinus lacus TaxID=1526573 RepID=A0A8J2V5M5_9FLAO|nr:glutamate dehydrogenase [Planktosalinus lacus]GGD81382.1 glutamate dehydrogenase [Planktosalinus lacus]